jgi:hypothetical protein
MRHVLLDISNMPLIPRPLCVSAFQCYNINGVIMRYPITFRRVSQAPRLMARVRMYICF